MGWQKHLFYEALLRIKLRRVYRVAEKHVMPIKLNSIKKWGKSSHSTPCFVLLYRDRLPAVQDIRTKQSIVERICFIDGRYG
jgi:hypothetical protein